MHKLYGMREGGDGGDVVEWGGDRLGCPCSRKQDEIYVVECYYDKGIYKWKGIKQISLKTTQKRIINRGVLSILPSTLARRPPLWTWHTRTCGRHDYSLLLVLTWFPWLYMYFFYFFILFFFFYFGWVPFDSTWSNQFLVAPKTILTHFVSMCLKMKSTKHWWRIIQNTHNTHNTHFYIYIFKFSSNFIHIWIYILYICV